MNAAKVIGCALASILLGGCGAKPPKSWVLPADFQVGVAGDGHLAEVLQRIRMENNLPALAAVAVTSTGIVELASTGVRAAGFPERVTDKDQWHLGSITKPMTATLAARLVEKGLIKWNTKIGEAVPELAKAMRAEYRDVTLEDLLRHEGGLPRDLPVQAQTSETARRGLPNNMPGWMLQDYDSKISPTENRLKGAAATLALPPVGPRGKFQYSNAGYIIAGVMLEQVAATPYEELFQRELLAPLGMSSTSFGAPGTAGKRDQPWGHWPTGKWFGPAWRPLDPGDLLADNPPTFAPCGRAHATLQDMARFAAAHLAGARGHPGLLSVESFRKLQTPDTNGIALDWQVASRDWAWGRWLCHSGSTARWYATLTLAPDRDLAMFAACNAFGERGDRACDQAAQALIRRAEAAEAPRINLTPSHPIAGANVTLTYLPSTGPLTDAKQVSLHHGIDGWKGVVDTPMTKTAAGTWEAVIQLRPDVHQMDFVFTDGTKWDNNSGLDWHVILGQSGSH
ncbi:MAG: serine hydrolase [Limisphaerales bacterium]